MESNIGEYLKERRVELGMSVAEVAKQVGLSESAWYKIEEGVRPFVPEYMKRVSNVLGFNMNVLQDDRQNIFGCEAFDVWMKILYGEPFLGSSREKYIVNYFHNMYAAFFNDLQHMSEWVYHCRPADLFKAIYCDESIKEIRNPYVKSKLNAASILSIAHSFPVKRVVAYENDLDNLTYNCFDVRLAARLRGVSIHYFIDHIDGPFPVSDSMFVKKFVDYCELLKQWCNERHVMENMEQICVKWDNEYKVSHGYVDFSEYFNKCSEDIFDWLDPFEDEMLCYFEEFCYRVVFPYIVLHAKGV